MSEGRPDPGSPAQAAAGEPGGTTTAAGELGRLVTECIERWDAEGGAALTALCREHPAHADALRRRMARLHELGLLGEDAAADAPLPERLGHFRILSLIGRGGMGVVYAAEQEGLGRRVALKVVRPELLWFPGARERFRREVQAIARLQHPGIVPVYAGGEDQGVPWYAMELVRGATLQEVLEQLAGRAADSLQGADLLAAVTAVVRRRAGGPAATGSASAATGESATRLSSGTWTAACLRVARQVAEALQHAHEQGVLHRDVKPGNVMLTPDGRVLLLDFGLAAAEGTTKLTTSAGQVGSLAWMSPEQVRGDHAAVTARTDVYSLGATLYELLALRTPFAGGSVEETRDRILDGTVAPVRDTNPSVPRDAETVCLTAMDREPARRYATAAALAADLANVLELRPIAARRLGPLLRARRWVQRRPAAATGLVLGTLLVVGGPVGYGLVQARAAKKEHQLNQQLGAANAGLDQANEQLVARGAELQRALDDEQAQRAAAERSFQAALQAVDHVLREMATDDLVDVPRMQLARLAALDRALELFPALEQDRGDDPLVQDERAALHESRGDVLCDIGRPGEGAQEFLRALDLRRRLLERDPSPARRRDLAATLCAAGKSFLVTMELARARPLLEEGVAGFRAALEAAPDDVDRQGDLAIALCELATLHAALGDTPPRDELLDEAPRLATAMRDGRPADAEVQWTAGRVFSDVADLHQERGAPEQGLQWAERALEAWRAAHAAEPGSRFYTLDVTTGLLGCAQQEFDLHLYAAADARLAEGGAILVTLLRDYPESERYRKRRVELLGLRATCAGAAGDHARAAEVLEELLPEQEALCARDPGRCDLRVQACQTRNNLANAWVQQRVRIDEALALLERAESELVACDRAGSLSAWDRGLLESVVYLEPLALLVADRLDGAREAMLEFEDAHARGPLGLRRAADLWNEWTLSARRVLPEGPDRARAEAEGRTRMLARLGEAIDAGYDDWRELSSTPSLDPFREDADFLALLERVQASSP